MKKTLIKPSALYVQKDSIYKDLGIDCYDEQRNALTYTGSNPVICHPPCRLFSKLKHFSKAPACEKLLAYSSIIIVRQNGGVLEHPVGSSLWEEMKLPYPGKYDQYGGFSICVNQSWFGHKAEKKTLLYICGITASEIPDYEINFNAIEFTVSSSKKRTQKKEITKRERSATPIKFAKFLIELASKCKGGVK